MWDEPFISPPQPKQLNVWSPSTVTPMRCGFRCQKTTFPLPQLPPPSRPSVHSSQPEKMLKSGWTQPQTHPFFEQQARRVIVPRLAVRHLSKRDDQRGKTADGITAGGFFVYSFSDECMISGTSNTRIELSPFSEERNLKKTNTHMEVRNKVDKFAEILGFDGSFFFVLFSGCFWFVISEFWTFEWHVCAFAGCCLSLSRRLSSRTNDRSIMFRRKFKKKKIEKWIISIKYNKYI